VTSIPVIEFRALLVRVAAHTCALNLAHVVEVVRPLPIEKVSGTPDMVWGLSIIRGVPVPVVDPASLFGESCRDPSRFVVVRFEDRTVALAVDAVIGMAEYSEGALGELPPLLQSAAASAVERIATLDTGLLYLLSTARLVPEPFEIPVALEAT